MLGNVFQSVISTMVLHSCIHYKPASYAWSVSGSAARVSAVNRFFEECILAGCPCCFQKGVSDQTRPVRLIYPMLFHFCTCTGSPAKCSTKHTMPTVRWTLLLRAHQYSLRMPRFAIPSPPIHREVLGGVQRFLRGVGNGASQGLERPWMVPPCPGPSSCSWPYLCRFRSLPCRKSLQGFAVKGPESCTCSRDLFSHKVTRMVSAPWNPGYKGTCDSRWGMQ